MRTAFVDQLIELEKRISEQKGDFAFFALFKPEGTLPDLWDVLVSADWLKSNQEAVEYFIPEIESNLGKQALMKLGRIVFIPPTDPGLHEIHRAFQVEHGTVEVWDTDFFGVTIDRGYIITSRSLHPTVRE